MSLLIELQYQSYYFCDTNTQQYNPQWTTPVVSRFRCLAAQRSRCENRITCNGPASSRRRRAKEESLASWRLLSTILGHRRMATRRTDASASLLLPWNNPRKTQRLGGDRCPAPQAISCRASHDQEAISMTKTEEGFERKNLSPKTPLAQRTLPWKLRSRDVTAYCETGTGTITKNRDRKGRKGKGNSTKEALFFTGNESTA